MLLITPGLLPGTMPGWKYYQTQKMAAPDIGTLFVVPAVYLLLARDHAVAHPEV